MKVLIIALDAQIREALAAQFESRRRFFECVGREWLKPAGPVDVQRPPLTIPDDIGVVINAISLECLEQNTDASLIDDLALLAGGCAQARIPLIQLSNSQVFDGIDGGRHREDDPCVPASRIGALLGRMEELIRGTCAEHIILRTGPLFSVHGNNLLTGMLARVKAGEFLQLSASGLSCPMHAGDLARVISAIVDQLSCGCDGWGTYHYTSSDPTSNYQFAETAIAVASQFVDEDSKALLGESDGPDDGDWLRPLLNCEKILNSFGIKQLPWRSSVVPTVKDYFEAASSGSKSQGPASAESANNVLPSTQPDITKEGGDEQQLSQ